MSNNNPGLGNVTRNEADFDHQAMTSRLVMDDTVNLLRQPMVGDKMISPYDKIEIVDVLGIYTHPSNKTDDHPTADTLIHYRVIEVYSPEDTSLTEEGEPPEEIFFGYLVCDDDYVFEGTDEE